MGEGIVIKHHANQNYTSDAFSSAIIKRIFDTANVKHQDFFMRSDMPCGGTLGAISSHQVSIRSVDIGIAQLAMHSSVETMALSDYSFAVDGLKCFLSCKGIRL
jgi:aspartyl aminopeptidase